MEGSSPKFQPKSYSIELPSIRYRSTAIRQSPSQ